MATYTGSDKRLAYLFGRTQNMQGATSEAAGTQGIIPKPEAGDNLKFLRGDGEWAEAQAGDPSRELTQEEYDALTEEEKMNGTTYYITDGENPPDEMALGNLSDVAINSPTDGQILKYDAENAEWVNGDETSVSIAQVLTSGTKAATVTIDGVDTDIYAPTPTEIGGTAEGTSVTLTDAAVAKLAKCELTKNITQDLHGYSKPWANGDGKNLLARAEEELVSRVTYTFDEPTGTYSLTVVTASNHPQVLLRFMGDTLTPMIGKTYTLSCTGLTETGTSTSRVYVYSYDADSKQSSLISGTGLKNNGKATFTVPNDCVRLRVVLRVSNSNHAVGANLTVTGLMLEAGDEKTTFEPYSNICPCEKVTSATVTLNGTTHTIDLTGTAQGGIYAGTIDTIRGAMKSTWKAVKISDLTWEETRYYFGVFSALPNDKKYGNSNMKADCYETTTETAVADMPDPSIKGYSSGTHLIIKDLQYAEDISAWLTARGDNIIYYELNTATSETVTALTLTAQNGTNTAATNMDGMDVEWLKSAAQVLVDYIDMIMATS